MVRVERCSLLHYRQPGLTRSSCRFALALPPEWAGKSVALPFPIRITAMAEDASTGAIGARRWPGKGRGAAIAAAPGAAGGGGRAPVEGGGDGPRSDERRVGKE